jgi:hypothetical protein
LAVLCCRMKSPFLSKLAPDRLPKVGKLPRIPFFKHDGSMVEIAAAGSKVRVADNPGVGLCWFRLGVFQPLRDLVGMKVFSPYENARPAMRLANA